MLALQRHPRLAAYCAIPVVLCFAALAPNNARAVDSSADAAPGLCSGEPKKETISSFKIYPKQGHEAALKAAMAAHAQKYHTDSWRWRVSEVLSGPDQGAYMVVEGPNSWTDLESRGDLGAEHMKDFDTNVNPHIDTSKSTPEMYSTFDAGLSTVAAGAFSNKTLIRHAYTKPGRMPRLLENLKVWKKTWEKRGMSVAVWTSFYSGESQVVMAIRLKEGWKDLETDMLNAAKAFEQVAGPKAYEAALEEVAATVEKIVDEMTEFKPELGSK